MIDRSETATNCDIVQTATNTGGAQYYCKTHGCVMRTRAGVPGPVVCDCAVQGAKDDE